MCERYFSLLEDRIGQSEQVRSSRHAACLVYKKQVLAYGFNSLKTHPIMLTYGRNDKAIYLHAEVHVLVRTINQHGVALLPKCDMYVLRLNKMGERSNSAPCTGCRRALDAFRIRNTFYT